MDWNALADAVIKVWNGIGWWACLIGGGLIIIWKALDAWGKKPKKG